MRAAPRSASVRRARLVFTAHSIPLAMAARMRLRATAARGLPAGRRRAAGHGRWDLVYQSRSGPPGQPWLEPDILRPPGALRGKACGTSSSAPVGFVSDHMEVLYDLDTEAQARAQSLGLRMVRTPTASSHPGYVEMVRDLIVERIGGEARATAGPSPALPDACAPGCCPRVEP